MAIRKSGGDGGWRVSLAVPVRHRDLFAAALEGLGLAVTVGAGRRVRLRGYGAGSCDRASVAAALAVAAAAAGIAPPDIAVARLPATDWAARINRDFPPIQVGRFFLHGAHVARPPPRGAIALRIDAGAAFGTGGHESTRLCLRALLRVARRRRVRRVLDMGTGAGVLAIAATKLTGATALAIDNDASAVAVARDNAAANGVGALVRVAAGDGYRADALTGEAPFDLVFENILARPVRRMAPALARRLAPGGVAVLSGFVARDADRVEAAHVAQGLVAAGRLREGDWVAVMMRRPRPAWRR